MQEELDVCIQAVVMYKKDSKGSYSVQETQRRYKEVLITYEIENVSDMSKISDETIGHIFLNSMDRELIEHLRFACGNPEFGEFIKKIIAQNYTVIQTLDDFITDIYHFSEDMSKKKKFNTNHHRLTRTCGFYWKHYKPCETEFSGINWFVINQCDSMRMSRAFFVVLTVTLPAAVAIINTGAVLLRPWGVL